MSIDLSLDRLRILVSHLPPYTRPTCHIAGTNGKGSVSALVSTILQSSSPPLKVGRYNSPHLVSIYDCITIDNIPVSPASYGAANAEVTEKDLEKGTKLTSFEILTLTALRVFERERVDVAVVEVGMGGRLDATNIIPDHTILVSALTAVDLDHQFFLGDTVDKIAFEKAGIAREKRPFVLGFQNPAHAEQVAASVKKAVDEVGAVLIPAITVSKRDWNTTVDGPSPESFSLLSLFQTSQTPPPQPVKISLPCFSSPLQALLPLYGAHQLENLGTALTVINALLTDPSCEENLIRNSPTHRSTSASLKDMIRLESVARGIKETKWPGRLSFHTVHLPSSTSTPNNAPPPPFLVLADGAHNPASAKTLGDYITHLLHQTIVSTTKEDPNYQAARRKPNCLNLNITYILSLSHSPPKTPLQTLSPLFSPLGSTSHFGGISASMTISVALLRFTSPEGMPWIKCVPPTEVEKVVKGLIPDANVWVVPDAADVDTKAENGPSEGEKSESALEKALRWAAGKRKEEDEIEQANLVVLAGSLYLVADFYRFLDQLIDTMV
jgi:folylpolyglutamate synthase/dihydrofolate synthase